MKICLISDLHIWSQTDMDVVDEEFDVLIVAGDVSSNYSRTIVSMNSVFGAYPNVKDVIVVPGNHDFYISRFEKMFISFEDRLQILREGMAGIGVHFLYRDSITIQGQKFVGCTGWTDVSKFDEEDVRCIKSCIADFKTVGGMTVELMKGEFEKDQKFLEENVDSDSIVITHFSPVVYAHHQHGDGILNRYFCNEDLTKHLNKKPKAWCFGHTHSNLMKDVNDVLVVSNQYGYHNLEEHEFVGQDFDPSINITEYMKR